MGGSRRRLAHQIRRRVLRCGLMLCRSLELEAVVGVCMEEDPCWWSMHEIRLNEVIAILGSLWIVMGKETEAAHNELLQIMASVLW